MKPETQCGCEKLREALRRAKEAILTFGKDYIMSDLSVGIEARAIDEALAQPCQPPIGQKHDDRLTASDCEPASASDAPMGKPCQPVSAGSEEWTEQRKVQAAADREGLLACRELLKVEEWDNLYDAIKRTMEDHSDFLAFMAGALSEFECCHGKDHLNSTPPMMWPEWVACIVKKAKQESAPTVEAWRDLGPDEKPNPKTDVKVWKFVGEHLLSATLTWQRRVSAPERKT